MIKIAGIYVILQKKKLDGELEKKIKKCADKLKHRGQQYIYFLDEEKSILNSPLEEKNNKFIAIDGQIYNINQINTNYLSLKFHKNDLKSDFEGIFHGYNQIGAKIFSELIGSFSGVLFNGTGLIGFKDPVGAKPLYYINNDKFFALSSEMKALAPLKDPIYPVNPGTIVSSTGSINKFYEFPPFIKYDWLFEGIVDKFVVELNNLIKTVVKDNINKETKTSALLSGGLDSTIIAYIAKNHINNLEAYTCGVKGSKDIFYAKKVAKKYDLKHFILYITLEDMLECLPNVIYALETFDAALVRSSLPMFLLTKKIAEIDNCDVLLTGEGGDELFGGYEYLNDFISPQALNQEIMNLLKVEHKTGLQRVDRIPYHFSIEARAPLFDRRVVELSLKIPPKLKIVRKGNCITYKWILRKAFEKDLQREFTWRKKQKFSDGAGSQFLLKQHINEVISDKEFYSEKEITPFLTARSKEELYYWRIFNSKFNPNYETIRELGITQTFEI